MPFSVLAHFCGIIDLSAGKGLLTAAWSGSRKTLQGSVRCLLAISVWEAWLSWTSKQQGEAVKSGHSCGAVLGKTQPVREAFWEVGCPDQFYVWRVESGDGRAARWRKECSNKRKQPLGGGYPCKQEKLSKLVCNLGNWMKTIVKQSCTSQINT